MAVLVYLDTSAAVPLFVREPATDRMRTFLEEQGAERIAISPWVVTEFASALAGKLRSKALNEAVHAIASSQWRLFRAGVRSLEVDNSHFEQAAQFAARPLLGLRAGDALHLAIAQGHGCTLVTLDERMAKAAAALGVPLAGIEI